MNRPIKFRAWNARHSDSNQRMMTSIYLANDGRVVMPDGAEWDIPVMQFTGLKDKNGKEIYEGDILGERGYNSKKAIGAHLVSFGVHSIEYDTRSGFSTVHAYGWFVQSENRKYEDSLVSGEYYEVIGNIYENPELLQVKE